jgi:DNA-binding NarL/FixJ family response regulator
VAVADPCVVIGVLLVDDHRLVRAGLAALLAGTEDIEVVGEAADGKQAVELASRLKPDVVLMDLSMPVLDGVSATRLILQESPATHVVVLTSFADHHRVTDAVAAGAVGYLLKDCDPREVVNAVRSAAGGNAPIDPRVARALLPASGPAAPKRDDALSARELQVLRLLAQGMANKQIGRALGISERTVKVHVGNVFRRLGVADRTSAALWARDNLPDDDTEGHA